MTSITLNEKAAAGTNCDGFGSFILEHTYGQEGRADVHYQRIERRANAH